MANSVLHTQNRQVRPSTVADAAAIRRIAQDAWRKTYEGLISPSSQDEYLAQAYNPEWLKKLHSRSDIRGFVALEEGEPVGFAMMSLGTPADDPPGAVLRSLYLHPGAQNKGLGRDLLDAVKAAARAEGIPMLWVAVHEQLQSARSWYEKQGFIYDGPAETTIGHDRIKQAVYRMPLPKS